MPETGDGPRAASKPRVACVGAAGTRDIADGRSGANNNWEYGSADGADAALLAFCLARGKWRRREPRVDMDFPHI